MKSHKNHVTFGLKKPKKTAVRFSLLYTLPKAKNYVNSTIDATKTLLLVKTHTQIIYFVVKYNADYPVLFISFTKRSNYTLVMQPRIQNCFDILVFCGQKFIWSIRIRNLLPIF